MKNLKNIFISLQKNMIFMVFILVIAVLALGIGVLRPLALNIMYPEAITVSAAKKKLPIYCVDTPEKKVSISFDAAWGATI